MNTRSVPDSVAWCLLVAFLFLSVTLLHGLVSSDPLTTSLGGLGMLLVGSIWYAARRISLVDPPRASETMDIDQVKEFLKSGRKQRTTSSAFWGSGGGGCGDGGGGGC